MLQDLMVSLSLLSEYFIPKNDTTQKIQTVFHLKNNFVKYRNYFSCQVDKNHNSL